MSDVLQNALSPAIPILVCHLNNASQGLPQQHLERVFEMLVQIATNPLCSTPSKGEVYNALLDSMKPHRMQIATPELGTTQLLQVVCSDVMDACASDLQRTACCYLLSTLLLSEYVTDTQLSVVFNEGVTIRILDEVSNYTTKNMLQNGHISGTVFLLGAQLKVLYAICVPGNLINIDGTKRLQNMWCWSGERLQQQGLVRQLNKCEVIKNQSAFNGSLAPSTISILVQVLNIVFCVQVGSTGEDRGVKDVYEFVADNSTCWQV
eukprot:TRINITY_DN33357_c0_g1_i1.p1 TRINITY_DN33357_c0_g1~~TRINITY_DN33357_c0_g1_i1.p1  ORF type:complete len:292 (-),score=39.69 TRINITY_DN33357_c0_g1_i1:555-1346(-)